MPRNQVKLASGIIITKGQFDEAQRLFEAKPLTLFVDSTNNGVGLPVRLSDGRPVTTAINPRTGGSHKDKGFFLPSIGNYGLRWTLVKDDHGYDVLTVEET